MYRTMCWFVIPRSNDMIFATFRKRMLLRNAHWILLVVCLLLVYVFYTASDESPAGVINANIGKNEDGSQSLTRLDPTKENIGGNSMFARLQALKPRFIPLMSKLSNTDNDAKHPDELNKDTQQKPYAKKPISPLIMGKNHTRLKTIL